MPSLTLLPFLFVFPLLAHAALKEIWWNITYTNANPDGLFERRVIGVNGSWPPPPIEVTLNDTLRVHATNGIDAPTSLHHHGMFFNGTSYYDGAVGVTQCGIPVGQTFTYDVPISNWSQWGTYWVHAHSSGQYVDGLRAPVVIHRNPDFLTNPVGADFSKGVSPSMPEAHAYDWEYTVILGDWYHTEHGPLVKHFISRANPGGAEPVPDSGLIYFMQNGTYLPPRASVDPSPATPSNIGFNENSTITFQQGKTYRLRIVNTSAFSMFLFWIEGHDMRIIEVDGTDIEESPVDVLALTVAQRYSILVTARNDSTPQNWIIHANFDTDMFDEVPDALIPNITSSITYSGSDPSTFATTDRSTVDEYPQVPDQTLVPLEKTPSVSATKQLRLEVNFDTMTDGTNRAMFNNITWNAPVVPSWFSAWSLDKDLSEMDVVYGPGGHALQKGEVIDLTVVNLDAGKHPFHLHGHKFAIMNRVEDITSDDPTLNPPEPDSLENPMRRDTIEIPSMGSVTIRWVSDNPGTWLFHCHIDWHLSAGLAVVFVEDPSGIQSLPPAPSFMFDQCHSLGAPTTGNAAGFNSSTDFKGLTVGPFLQNNGWHSKGIGAMAGCVLAALLGMITVAWYAYGHQLSDEEVEEETRRKMEAKERRMGMLKGVFGRK